MTTDTQTLPVTTSTSGFRWRRVLLAILAVVATLLIVAAVGSFAYASANDGKILSGVTIGGVNVSGLTPEAAKSKLAASLPDVAKGALTVKAGSVTRDISYAELNRAYNLDTTLDEALQVGRSGNPLDQIGEQVRTMTTGVALTPSISYDAQALEQRVRQIVATAQVTPVNASISFQ